MNGVYNQLVRFLKQNVSHPIVNIVPTDYTPAPLFSWLSTCLGILQFFIITTVIVGPLNVYIAVAGKLGHSSDAVPEFVNDAHANRIMYGMGAFVGGNIIKSQLVKNNAFEIYAGPNLVFSGITTGIQKGFLAKVSQRLVALGYHVRA
eukprot:GHVH01008846.1.p1 GENE.GHVH01008846.1~~GHVH01008846.1.p1  ORF type:complete len:148 (+),score=15.03 GHVH01008846.1:240-683(+)